MINLGLGTAAIGWLLYINVQPEEQKVDFSLPEFKANGIGILEDTYEKGVRFFDASPGYANI